MLGRLDFVLLLGLAMRYWVMGSAGIFQGGEKKVRGGATDLCAFKAVVLVPSLLHIVEDDNLAVCDGE